jgi:transketolase C-terminal domain/subunit
MPEPLVRIGVRGRWVESGGTNEVFAHHGRRSEDIAAAAKEVISDA